MPFITFEGIEGSGKTTQARLLAVALGPGTLLTQEPGGTAIGRAVRDVLLDRRHRGMTPVAEMLLYFADRAQHVGEVLRPALQAGRTVISDRYVDSTIAYQGYGRGIELPLIRAVARAATAGLTPDLTLLIDVPVELGLARVGRRGAHDRLEAEVVEFHQRVRAGYRELAAQEPDRWVVVPGEEDAESVEARVLAEVTSRGLLRGARA